MRYRDHVHSSARAYLFLIATLIVALSAVPTPLVHAATTRLVSKSGIDSGDCSVTACLTIGYAITIAEADDTISIGAGTFIENLQITKNLILSGAGQTATTIDGNQSGSVVAIVAGFEVNIAGVTLRNGNGTPGGAIVNNGTLALSNSAINGNTSQGSPGGGIYNTGTLTLNNSIVSSNTAGGFGGGIYSSGGTVTLTNNSTVSDNKTTSLGAHGGGIYLNASTLAMTRSTVDGNSSAFGDGGGIFGSTSTLILSDSIISNNKAPNGAGGGIDVFTGSSLTLNGSTVISNTAGVFGGGIYNDVGTIRLNNSTINVNVANGSGGGGGIYNDGNITLTNSTINGNIASLGGGGGINNIASATLMADHATISGNRSGGVGGGIASSSLSSVTLSNSSVISNTTAIAGGGIHNSATLQLTNTVIADNLVDNTTADGNGGGIANSGRAIIDTSRILRNRAVTSTGSNFASNGGGIIHQGGILTITNSTISDNVLDAQNGAHIGAGGGVFSDNDLKLTVRNSVISNHTKGSGIYINEGGQVTLEDVTVRDNQSLSNGGGMFIGANAAAQVTRVTVQNNTSAAQGGGVSIASNAAATLTDVTISDNQSTADAGGVYIGLSTVPTATVAITRAAIQNNHAGGYGGGIESRGNLTVSDSQIIANTTLSAGGGIDNMGVLIVTNSLISSNRLENPGGDGIRGRGREFGGGIWSRPGSKLVLRRSTISGHRVGGDPDHSDGGGLFLDGVTAVLTDVVVSGNEALGNGGGIYAQNTALTITGSTISGNLLIRSSNMLTSTSEGGGIGLYGSGTLTITNSTISGNQSDNIAGGIFWATGVTTTLSAILDQVTITNNSARQGGGIWSNDQTTKIHVERSIVAGNHSRDNSSISDCHGRPGWLISEGRNLFGSVNDECSPTNNDFLTDTLHLHLGPLQYNHGPTPTHALLADSPAMDAAGVCSSPDQRDISRPQGAACDIGAYEAGPAARLVFTGEPPSEAIERQKFTKPFTVTVQDDLGNAASLAGNVTLTIAIDPDTDSPRPPTRPRAKLTGTVTRPLVHGIATFNDIAIDQAGNGFVLSATSSTTNIISASSSVLNILATVPIPVTPGDRYEANDDILKAVPLVFDSGGNADYYATITSTTDVDVFKLVARPNSLITITIAHRLADYDLVLLRDPRDVTADLTDTLDLSNLIDLPRDTSPRGMVPRGMVPRGMVPRGMVPDEVSLDSLVVDATANPGTADERLALPLPLGGTYYIAVLSTHHETSTIQYHLNIKLEPRDLRLPSVIAQPPSGLQLSPLSNVDTIYLTNFTRMRTHYPSEEQPAIGEIQRLLTSSSPLITHSIVLDLPSVLTETTDLDRLNALYNQWDAGPDQPLFANEVASQIQRILSVAIAKYYTNTTNIVLVGSDDVLPFARVPDENAYGNEQEYYDTLRWASKTLIPTSTLAASLHYGFMQTDDIYASHRQIIYRGRQLALPDMGIGRLVEHPSDIVRYLHAYSNSNSFVVDTGPNLDGQPQAFVTGYSFLKDQATEVITDLNKLGVSTTQLVSDTWTTEQLEQNWFSGQLPQLTSIYTPTAGGPSTHYALVSLNGHFSHNATLAAVSSSDGDFEAQRILTPTIAPDHEPYAFFKRWQNATGSATLLYSIGCHSGLSVPDSAFDTSQTKRFAADFASAVLKQGGNWIGNTGYGYGDTNVVGYSEQLAVFFTQELGRDERANGEYTGVTIGQALMRAKQHYVREQGIGGFSVADEKVITGWTLYGLPFIRVKVPKPVQAQLPPSPKPPTPDGNGTFTRNIVITTDWLENDIARDKAVQAEITDSLVPNDTRTITGTPQGNWGAPVLPVLSIPLGVPLQSERTVPELPQLRGVRLLEASALPVQEGYTPRITSPVTDADTTSQIGELSLLNLWTPDLTFGAIRTTIDEPGTPPQMRDVLLVHPAQFKANNKHTGDLRQFRRMVLELTYIDPLISNVGDDHLAPMIMDLNVEMDNGSVASYGSHVITFTATVSDRITTGSQVPIQQADSAVSSVREVRVLYTVDGMTWEHAELSGSGNTYQVTVPVTLQSRGLFAYVDAVDLAGNVTTRVINRGVVRLYLSTVTMGAINVGTVHR